MSKLVAFTGLMGSGKTECANIIDREIVSTCIHKLASPIYEIQDYIYTRCDLELKTKDRELMQAIGNWGRNKSPSLWLDLWVKDYKELQDSRADVYVVDDLRFDNEAKAIKELGGIIVKVSATRETREGRLGKLIGENDVSELGVSEAYWDAIIYNDGSIESLTQAVKDLIELKQL